MGSYSWGKQDAVDWIKANTTPESSILDVGASDGKWRTLLPEYPNMDAVEIFEPYVEWNRLREIYREVFIGDIRTFEYDYYDMVIIGDVLEHMTVEEAQKVLAYTRGHCGLCLVALPFLYPQDEVNGNVHEIHVQADLTPDVIRERYPELDPLRESYVIGYGYYVMRGDGTE